MDKVVVDDWGQCRTGKLGALRAHVESGRLSEDHAARRAPDRRGRQAGARSATTRPSCSGTGASRFPTLPSVLPCWTRPGVSASASDCVTRESGPSPTIAVQRPGNHEPRPLVSWARRSGLERRLTAILAADVVGYSRLMGEDEVGTLERLKALRRDLVQPSITARKGRIVKLMGDGLLAEFPSVVEAVLCAVEIQRAMPDREPDRPEGARITLRIGVNLGDIIGEGSDIYGDGVNLAARLEGLARPGGICVSSPVRDQVKGKLDLSFADLGERQVKNFDDPVRVYRIVLDGETDGETLADGPAALELPDKPSIAVLPFSNMSGDPEQDYFADGITEDIITALSRVRWLFVIARNSTFAYKGASPDVRQVSRDLGVLYVLEGSVRRGGNRIRITAQLIEATTGRHVWADRYDRDLGDVFALQDDLTETLIAAIEPELSTAERERAIRKPPETLDAWSWFQRGLWHHYRFTKEDNAEAQVLFRKAIALDPTFSRALAALAHALYWDTLFGFTETPQENAGRSRAACQESDLAGRQGALCLFLHGPHPRAQGRVRSRHPRAAAGDRA